MELVIYLISLAFGIFLLLGARQFPPSTMPGVPSSAFFPNIISTVIIALSLILMVTSLVKRIKTRASGGEVQTNPEQIKFVWKQALRIAGVILLLLLYGLLWHFNIGHFLINSIVFFIPITIIYGGAQEKKWWKTSIYVVIVVVIAYVLFRYLFGVGI